MFFFSLPWFRFIAVSIWVHFAQCYRVLLGFHFVFNGFLGFEWGSLGSYWVCRGFNWLYCTLGDFVAFPSMLTWLPLTLIEFTGFPCVFQSSDWVGMDFTAGFRVNRVFTEWHIGKAKSYRIFCGFSSRFRTRFVAIGSPRDVALVSQFFFLVFLLFCFVFGSDFCRTATVGRKNENCFSVERGRPFLFFFFCFFFTVESTEGNER